MAGNKNCETMSKQFVVCEEYPTYRHHIRLLDGKEPVPGGYTEPYTALCGQVIGHGGGWDLPVAPLPTLATKERYCRSIPGAYTVCVKCCDLYLAQKGAP